MLVSSLLISRAYRQGAGLTSQRLESQMGRTRRAEPEESGPAESDPESQTQTDSLREKEVLTSMQCKESGTDQLM